MKKKREVDLKAVARDAMIKYGFNPRFPDPVLREVNAVKPGSSHDGPEGLKEMRELLWSSIDNYDSMDLDQIEYCEAGEEGEIHVRVAIADVDSYVPRQSRTDRHASYNGTSVYTGVETFTMLPVRLSEGITSLLPGHDCMAIVIAYSVMPDGSVRYGDICRAMVSNKAKLVYEEVGDWLEGSGSVPQGILHVPGLEEQVRMQNEAAMRLRRQRMANGALDLQTLEARAVMDDDEVKDIVVQEQNLARCLIEEFMVAANRTVVNFLVRSGVPMIQRIVRTPRNWAGIVETVREYGEKLPADPDSRALSVFLSRQRDADPEGFPDLSLTVVKLMGPGEYVAYRPGEVPIGHFALAVKDYTHSTAPNRRYVDLIIQRLLKSVMGGRDTPYRHGELIEMADWLTDREKLSQKVERFMLKAAAARLLNDSIGRVYDAIVTGASEKGTYVRIYDPPVEGKVMSGDKGLIVGQKVRVRLIMTNPARGYIDFECIGRMKAKKDN